MTPAPLPGQEYAIYLEIPGGDRAQCDALQSSIIRAEAAGFSKVFRPYRWPSGIDPLTGRAYLPVPGTWCMGAGKASVSVRTAGQPISERGTIIATADYTVVP